MVTVNKNIFVLNDLNIFQPHDFGIMAIVHCSIPIVGESVRGAVGGALKYKHHFSQARF